MYMTKDQAHRLYQHFAAIADEFYEFYEASLPSDFVPLNGATAEIPAIADDGITLDVPTYAKDADWTCGDDAHDTEIPPAPVKEPEQPETDTTPPDTLSGNVLNLLRRSGAKLTCGEIAKRLDTEDTKAISKILNRLIDGGDVSHEGERRAKRYFSCEKAMAAE